MPQSEMKVENLKNYGKNIMEMDTARIPAGKLLRVVKATGLFGVKLLWALGPMGTTGVLKNFKSDMAAAQSLDWSDLRARGIAQKDLDNIIKKFVGSHRYLLFTGRRSGSLAHMVPS